jgi:Undecaprenyl-phosphate galactose phosphotransferase WbaP
MATSAQLRSISEEILPVTQASPWGSGGLMFFTDIVALVCAGFLGSQAWRLLVNIGAPPIYAHFWPAIALFPIIFAAEGLYPGVGVGPVELLRRLVRGTSLIYLMLTATLFLTKGGDVQSRGGFFASWVLSIVFLPLARAVVHHYFAGKPWFGVPVLVLGGGDTAALLVEKLRLTPELALKPMACLDDDPRKQGYLGDVPVLGPLSMAKSVARSTNVRHAIVAMPGLSHERLLALLEKCSVVFPHVYLIPNLMGLASIPVSPMDVGGVLALELRHNLLFPINRYLKRALDLALVVIMMPVAIVITLLSALWVFIVNPGNPFYWHERDGENGQLIRILKLRTMYPNADVLLEQYLEHNLEAREEWERFCKLRKDPRVLPGVGHFLRRSSLDELPQLWNILIGQMSLVGPRPFPSYHMAQFHPAFRDLRTKVRPGLTGLWQISARSEGDLDIQAVLDTYYIRNWSLWLDIFILSRTARAVFLGRGAY